MHDLKAHAEWLLVNGTEDDGYWKEQARIDDWIDAGRDEAARPPAKPEPGSDEPVRLISLTEAARRLSRSKSWVERQLVRTGQVAVLRPTGSTLIVAADLDRWISENSGSVI